MLASYQREGACPELCFASECCPWRFDSCSRLLAHQLFNSLQPCGLQPRVLVSSEHTSLRRGGEWGWTGGCGAEAGQRTPTRKQSRGMGNRSPTSCTAGLGTVASTFLPSARQPEAWVLLPTSCDDPGQIISLFHAQLSPPVK